MPQNYAENRGDAKLIWVSAHSGNPGNETAHNTARRSIGRAVRNDSSPECKE